MQTGLPDKLFSAIASMCILLPISGRSQSIVFSTIVGQPGQRATVDGTNSSAHFYQPRCITLDSAGNIFVTDDTTIRKVTISGTNYVVTTLAGTARVSGGADGTNGGAHFTTPSGIVADAATNLYVADYGNNTIRKIAPNGTNWVVTTIAGNAGVTGSADGTGTSAQFNNPFGLSMDNAGNIFVADSGNDTIRRISLQASNWTVATLAGSPTHSGSADGTNLLASFKTPRDVAVAGAGLLYVTDRGNGTIRCVTQVGTNWIVTTAAGVAGQKGTVDGINSAARFSGPDGIGMDAGGNLYVTDTTDDVIRRLTPSGSNWSVTTIGGDAGVIGSSDGIGSSALFNYPDNIKIDSAGNLHIADRDNYIIRLGAAGSNSFALPVIVNEPQNTVGFAGSNAEFSVTAAGNGLNYSWQYNDVAIPGATNSTLVIANVSTNNAGDYRVVVTNGYGFTNSQEAMLMVTTPLGPMLDLTDSGEDPTLVQFTNLAVLNGAHGLVSLGSAPWLFRLHNYLAFYDGQYWCMWSHGPAIEDLATQHVRYATSADGLNWSADNLIVGPPVQTGFRYIARGFWERDGQLLALASLDEAGPYFGPSLALLSFQWNPAGLDWSPLGMVFTNAINNFPPAQIATGEWAMVCRDHDLNEFLLTGGLTSPLSWQNWDIVEAEAAPPFLPEEPQFWLLPDNRLLCVFRDAGGSKRLFRAVSPDNGRTWSVPEQSNFPDADSKFFGMRTSRGYYVLISNADPAGRNPLCMSTSEDGITFTHMARLPVPVTPQGGPFDATATSGTYQYPHAMENDGQLYIAYSRNKTAIEVVKLSLDEVDKLRQGAQAGLLLRYTFDEAGGPALDYGVAPQSNGIFAGSASRTNDTPSGTGLALDLSDGNIDYVDAGNTTKLSNLSNLTLTAWINLRANPTLNARLLDNLGGGAGFSWKIVPPLSGAFAASNFLFGLNVNDANNSVQSTAATGADHKWVFYAMTYDGGSGTNNVKFYSGTASNSLTQLGNPATLNAGLITDTSNDFCVGGSVSTSTNVTPPAWIDDVRVYNCVLPIGQLEAVREEGAPYTPTGLPFYVRVEMAGPAINLSWQSDAGHQYQVWTRNGMTNASWMTIGNRICGTGETIFFTNVPTTNAGTSFYRVQRL